MLLTSTPCIKLHDSTACHSKNNFCLKHRLDWTYCHDLRHQMTSNNIQMGAPLQGLLTCLRTGLAACRLAGMQPIGCVRRLRTASLLSAAARSLACMAG